MNTSTYSANNTQWDEVVNKSPHAENIQQMRTAGYVCSPNPVDLPGATMYPGGPGIPAFKASGFQSNHQVQVSKVGVTLLSFVHQKPMVTFDTVKGYLSVCPDKSLGGELNTDNWD